MKAVADQDAIKQHIAEVVPFAGPAIREREPGEDEGEEHLPELVATDEREVPPHLLEVPGLVGHITRWITKTALYPQPLLALGAALAVVGTAAGRKYAGPTRSGTHLYVLGLAGTGAGKNHAAKMCKRLLRGAELDDMVGPGQFASEPVVYETLSAQPQRICFMDEFGSYITKMNNPRGSGHEKAVSGALRIAWGASFDTMSPPAWAKSSGRELKPIISPSLSIYAMSVHEEFYAGLQSADVANGFLNRFLILSTHQRPQEVEPELDEDETPPALVQSLQFISARPNEMSVARRVDEGKPAVRLDWATPAARETYQEFRKGIIEGRNEEQAKLLSRVPEMAVRLATIRAIGVKRVPAPAVTLEDITWGCELAMWSAKTLIAEVDAYMAETEHQARSQEVIRYLKKAPRKTMTKSALIGALKHKYKARELRDILESLADAEQIDWSKSTLDGACKPTEFIRYIGGK